MLSYFFKFLLLSYGKIYSLSRGMEQSFEMARFSAVAQFSLLLTLNAMSVIFILDSIFGAINFFSFIYKSEIPFKKILCILVGIGVFVSIDTLSKNYKDEYENMDFDKSKSLKWCVDLYPYGVVTILIISMLI